MGTIRPHGREIIDSETGEIISDIMERPDPVRLHQTGLEVAGPLSYGDWSNFGRTLQRVEGAIHWWLGDWYRYGEATYGEIAAQAVDELGFSYETVKADVWVACKVESVRRRTGLSWSHHKEVAALEPEQQDYWLARAEAEGMSREELRYAIRLARKKEEARKGSTKVVADSATTLVGDLPPHKTDSELAKLADTSERGIRQSAYIAFYPRGGATSRAPVSLLPTTFIPARGGATGRCPEFWTSGALLSPRAGGRLFI